MKKTLLSLIGILIGLFVILSLLDFRGEYVVEEKIWNANKRLSEAARNPEVVPDKVFQQIADDYQKVITNFPESKLVPMAHIFLGRVNLAKKDYETARQKFRVVFEKFPDNKVICAEAAAAIGSSYELQNNWSEALKVYEKLKSDYPVTDLGLNVPLYIASFYAKNGQLVNAQSAYSDAVVYYSQMAADHSDSLVGLKSLQLLSNCYVAQKKWSDAVNVMGKIIMKYTAPNVVIPMSKTINAIVLTQIGNYDMAILIYQDFIAKNPDSRLNKPLTEIINAFKDLKTKNVKVTPKTP